MPPEISWWPLAPGWYLLIAATLLCLGWFGWRSWRRYRRNAYRRAALAELDVIATRVTTQSTDSSIATALGGLLRRTALAVVPREAVAARRGVAWHVFLNERLPAAQHRSWDWIERAYRPGRPIGEQEADQWMESTRAWITRHRGEDAC